MNNGKCADELGWDGKIPHIVRDGVLGREQGNGMDGVVGLCLGCWHLVILSSICVSFG